MKNSFLFITMLSIICLACTEISSGQYWAKTYDVVGYEGSVHSIVSSHPTNDGAFILGGHYIDYLLPKSQIWVLKVDSGGNIIWEKTYEAIDNFVRLRVLQPTSDGGYIITGIISQPPSYNYDILILKLDSSGNVLWQKAYGTFDDTYDNDDSVHFIQQTSDGGYILGGGASPWGRFSYMLILKLDSNGEIEWKKTSNSGTGWAPSIQQTSDGGYITVTTNGYILRVLKLDNGGNIILQKILRGHDSNIPRYITQTADGNFIIAGETRISEGSTFDLMVLQLDINGNLLWQKSYGSNNGDEQLTCFQQTIDEDYIVLTHSNELVVLKLTSTGDVSWQKTYGRIFGEWVSSIPQDISGGYMVTGSIRSCDYHDKGIVLKLDENGNIPYCNIVGQGNLPSGDSSLTVEDSNITFQSISVLMSETNLTSQVSSTTVKTICSGTSVDSDNDAIADGEDNCSVDYNPFQLDTFPPGGNGVGDVCECEGNFDCDEDCDGTDASTFKVDFGRSTFYRPCFSGHSCNGDFDCDHDVDGTDAVKFKEDFGRSSFNHPCPLHDYGYWCSY